MFTKKLELIFITVTLIALAFLLTNIYDNHQFKNNPISSEIQQQINAKEEQIIENIRDHYGIDFKVPLIISDKMPSNLYGAATLNNGTIKVFINKKRIKESLNYILNDVLPHEYAHALMFAQGHLGRNDGHTLKWQQACLNLGGSRCDRYVNHDDVISEKISF